GVPPDYIERFVANTPYEYQFYNPYALPNTSPLLEPFFNTTLYKLLYYHAPNPKIPTYQYNALNYNLLTQMSTYKYPLVIGANETLSSAYPYFGSSWTAGYRQLNYFKPVFISSNGLLKIYEIDYTVLDSGLNITNATVYANKTGTLTLKNTGTTTYNITQIFSNDSSCTATSLPLSLAPEETIEINFTLPETQSISVGDALIIKVKTSIPDFYVQRNVTVIES
ncbi:MAG: hypothetical protein QW279_01450, partial [Candidatus Jordarchaeaceae archaeon]